LIQTSQVLRFDMSKKKKSKKVAAKRSAKAQRRKKQKRNIPSDCAIQLQTTSAFR